MEPAVHFGGPVYVRVSVAWRMPAEAEVPAELRPYWPPRWFGAKWREGRLLSIPAWIYRWLRRTQGDYMERCFLRVEGHGRSYLQAVPCPRSEEGLPPAAIAKRRAAPERPTPVAGVVVRRCGCGRRPPETSPGEGHSSASLKGS